MSLNSIPGLTHISTVVNEANRLIEDYKTGRIRPLKTFSPKLDRAIGGIVAGDQITIAARPGVGKSAVVNALLDGLYDNNPEAKLVTLYFSLEMPNRSQIMRLYSKGLRRTTKELYSTNSPITEEDWNGVMRMSENLKKREIYFRDRATSATLWKRMMDATADAFPEHQVISIVDHTRLITKAGTERSEEEKITEFMATAVEHKNITGSVNIFLSQLNRNIESATGADRERVGRSIPVLTDIFGSDSVGQFSTLVLGLHRPERYNIPTYEYDGEIYDTTAFLPTFIIKQRDGGEGMVPLYHDLAHYRIVDEREQLLNTNF